MPLIPNIVNYNEILIGKSIEWHLSTDNTTYYIFEIRHI